MQRLRQPVGWIPTLRGAIPGTCVGLLAVAVGAFAVSYWHPRAVFLSMGCGALAIVLVPLARTMDPDEFVSPWSILVVTITISMALRGAYVGFGLLSEAEVQRVYFLYQDVPYFLAPGALVLLSLATITAAYGFRRGRRPAPTVLRQFRPNAAAIAPLAVTFSLIGLAAFVAFMQQTGGFEDIVWSRKRAMSPGLELGEDFRNLGYLRYGATLAGVGFFALTALWTMNRAKMLPWRLPVLGLLFINATLFPFYASSRGSTLWVVLILGAILHYCGYRINGRHLLLGIVVILVTFYAMTFLRAAQGADEIDYRSLAAGASPAALIDSIVVNRNLLDVWTTAHVINNVGGDGPLEWKYGQSIYAWVAGPIPRELWPNKPRLAIGPEVGILVYGTKRSGVPPGFIGEMWWNFHIFGVLLGSVLLGLAMRTIHSRLSPRNSRDFVFILLYCAGFLRIGMYLLGTAAGQALFTMVMDVTAVLVFLWLCDHRRLWFRGGRAAVRVPTRSPPVPRGDRVEMLS